MSFEINNKKTIRSWAFFDWANSAFALIITTAIFPPYFLSVAPDQLQVLGISLSDSALLSYTISLSYIFISILLPLLSGIADQANKRKSFLILFTLLGSISCCALYFFSGAEKVWLAVSAYLIGIIGFECGKLFYDSFLPIIVSKDKYDMVSAKGFAFGYIGSVILLMLNLMWILKPEFFGFQDAANASRTSFLSVGIWWAGFAMFPFIHLPNDERMKIKKSHLKAGFKELQKAYQTVRSNRNTINFLTSYFFYISGAITVIYLASTFATKVLAFEQTELIVTILILQLVGIAGAYIFGAIAKRRGNKFSLNLMIVIWCAICIAAFFVQSKTIFFVIAGFVGLVMGGIQATSRATYSKLIGHEKENISSLFSFYTVLEKVAIVLGTLFFGLIETLTGNLRNSVLVLIVFFVIALIPLNRMKQRIEVVS